MRLILNTVLNLALQGDLEAASHQFADAHGIYRQLLKKIQTAESFSGNSDQQDKLKLVYLECLLQEGECLALQERFNVYTNVEAEMREVIASMSPGFLEANLRMLVQIEEQRASARMMREKQERAGRRAEEERELVARMSRSTLECETSEEIKVTPGCDKTSHSRIG